MNSSTVILRCCMSILQQNVLPKLNGARCTARLFAYLSVSKLVYFHLETPFKKLIMHHLNLW